MEPLFSRPQLSLTRNLTRPTFYARAIDAEYKQFALNEERMLQFAGRWRPDVFGVGPKTPLDLEIGTGNGLHFFEQSRRHLERCLVGLELKYKPLIQTIRRVVQKGQMNGRVGRAHAFNLDLIFAPQEIDDVFVHFPDPWTSPRKPQNRVLTARTISILGELQKSGSYLEFKTDSKEAFEWCLANFQSSPYQIQFLSQNVHCDLGALQSLDEKTLKLNLKKSSFAEASRFFMCF